MTLAMLLLLAVSVGVWICAPSKDGQSATAAEKQERDILVAGEVLMLEQRTLIVVAAPQGVAEDGRRAPLAAAVLLAGMAFLAGLQQRR